MKTFTYFIETKCNKSCPQELMQKFLSNLQKITWEEFKECFNHANKNILCHLAYCVCYHNERSNTWELRPTCQENCLAYIRGKSCEKFSKLLHNSYPILKYCVSNSSLWKYDCLKYPMKSSGKCLYMDFGKSLPFLCIYNCCIDAVKIIILEI